MNKLILLLAIVAVGCRHKTGPENYRYKNAGSAGVYFQRENKDTIFCVLRPGSEQRYYCEDNGYFYVYSAQCNPVTVTSPFLDSIGIGFYPSKDGLIHIDTNYVNLYR